MSMFKTEANDLCLAAPQTRRMFIQYWESHGVDKRTTSSEFEDSFGSSIDIDSSVGSLSVRETSDSESSTSSQILPANSHGEKMLMEYKIGTVEVHLGNLVAPHPSRATRVLDHEHVGMLTESFANDSCGQIVIFQGMVTDGMVSPSTLYQEGTGKVEVLGGNHSREALQTLYRKGTLSYSTVNCDLFRPLPRIFALSIGYAHNTVLHEKVKPVLFMDKARLMRECRPSGEMTKDETVKWKDSLVTVLGVKDRRRLVQSYGVHLAMANLQSELWAKGCLAAETNLMSEKFMRGFSRLEDSNDKLDCIDMLLSKGAAAFKQKVKTLIDAGRVKGKKNEKKRKAYESTHEVNELLEDTDPDYGNGDVPDNLPLIEDQSSWKLKYEELMEKYKQLEEENASLKIEVKDLQEEREVKQAVVAEVINKDRSSEKTEIETKRRRCLTNMFKKGETVMAFWREESTGEETWQEATVTFAYSDGKCRVQWKSDGMISTLGLHEVQKLNFELEI